MSRSRYSQNPRRRPSKHAWRKRYADGAKRQNRDAAKDYVRQFNALGGGADSMYYMVYHLRTSEDKFAAKAKPRGYW